MTYSLNNLGASIRDIVLLSGKNFTNSEELITYAQKMLGSGSDTTIMDLWDKEYDNDNVKGNNINKDHYLASQTSDNLLFQNTDSINKNSSTLLCYDISDNTMKEVTDKAAIFDIIDNMDGKTESTLKDINGKTVNKADFLNNSNMSIKLVGDGFEIVTTPTPTTPTTPTTPAEVKYTEDERKFLDSILNKNGKIDWNEHMAFMQLADTSGDGVLTEAEKTAYLEKLKNDPTAVESLKKEIKSIQASWVELLNIDKNNGTNDDLKVQTDEFEKQFGSDLTKLADKDGNGTISRLEYQTFVKLLDQDGDGKLLDNEVKAAQSNIAISGESNSLKDQFKAIYDKLAKYNGKYVPMLSGKLDTTTPPTDHPANDVQYLDSLLDGDGKYSQLEHLAFTRFADQNGDGIISQVEKEAAMTALQTDGAKEKLKAEYAKIQANEADLKSLDKNGDGKVSKDEFAAKYGNGLADVADLVLKTDGNIDINEFLTLVKYADKDGDGKLDSNEITAADAKLNNTSDRDSKRSERLKLKSIFWKDTSIRNQSYNYMTRK